MFDVSNPQQRERLLVILTGIALGAIVMGMLPAQFTEINKLKTARENLKKDIDNLIILAKNKDEIQSRLNTLATQALASSGNAGNEGISGYRIWLEDLARKSGLRYLGGPAPVPSGNIRGVYAKHTFTVSATGTLDQIAEFVRRFHSADYLHLIQNFSPKPSTTILGEFSVIFKIEALALPQTRGSNVPAATDISEDEGKMLVTIRDRAILTQYQPPKPPAEPAPPSPPFFDHPYSYVNAIVEVDGKPQCWIDIRTTGKKYYLFEGESFFLGATRCTVKKIGVASQRVVIAADGNVYAVRYGKNFDQHDELCYFVTLVNPDGTPWTADSAEKPLCGIEYEIEGKEMEAKKYRLDVEESFPMKHGLATIKKIDPATRRVQIEAAGIVYSLRSGGSFPEFTDE